MTKAFDKILAGLKDARAHAQGKAVKGLAVRQHPLRNNEVAAVRLQSGLTQAQFAEVLGASIGTVRKWESGERSPSGAANSLLRLLAAEPKVVARTLGIKLEAPRRTPRSQLVASG